MKVIIAGSRDIVDIDIVKAAYEASGFIASEIVSGAARGVDRLGEVLASEIIKVNLKLFPADWNAHGKGAGYIRNAQMAKYADALIAVWDGQSRGTANMISQARNNKLDVFIYLVKDSNEENSNH